MFETDDLTPQDSSEVRDRLDSRDAFSEPQPDRDDYPSVPDVVRDAVWGLAWRSLPREEGNSTLERHEARAKLARAQAAKKTASSAFAPPEAIELPELNEDVPVESLLLFDPNSESSPDWARGVETPCNIPVDEEVNAAPQSWRDALRDSDFFALLGLRRSTLIELAALVIAFPFGILFALRFFRALRAYSQGDDATALEEAERMKKTRTLAAQACLGALLGALGACLWALGSNGI
ncbi:MAG: hypothetical protein ACI4NP_05560 [Thermoguttaceae bacterium]